MENQEREQIKNQFGSKIKNEYLKELNELIMKCPENISLTIFAAENVQPDINEFEGLILAVGKPRTMIRTFQDAFKQAPDLRELIFDAVSYYKLK